MKNGTDGSTASSSWPWLFSWGGDRGYDCPYCFPLQKLDKRNGHQYSCPSCEVTFDNELEPIIPVNYDASQEAPLTRQTCIPLEQGKLTFDNAFTSNDILCRTCHNHQNILLQLLASSDAETPQQIRAYKDELERRYPLCSACRGRVQERLRLLQYKLTSRRLGGNATSMKKNKVTTVTAADRSRSSKRLLAFLDTFIVQSAFFIVHYFDDVEGMQIGAIATVASMVLVSVLNYWQSSLLSVAFALMLGFLRIALLASINEHTEDSDYLSNPMYLLSFACVVLLYQLHYSRPSTSATKKLQKSPSLIKGNPNENQMDGYHFATTNWSRSIDDIPVTPVSVARGGGASGSEDITMKLNSALESLGPTTPLTTRFMDLPSSAKTNTSVVRNSPFAVPPSVLTATTQEKNTSTFNSFASSKSTIASKMPTPRPSRLAHDIDSGLEGVMAGFSLRESPQSPKSFRGSQRYENPFLISFAFIFVRLFLHSQHGTISLLLLLSAALRDVNWHRCPTGLKAFINCLFVIRLFWLVLIMNADMLQSLVPPLICQKHFFGELAMDFIILASR